MWEAQCEALLMQEAEGDDDAEALLEEARTNLNNLYISQHQRTTEAINTKILAVAERGTKYDYDTHKDKKPRDTSTLLCPTSLIGLHWVPNGVHWSPIGVIG